MIDMTTTDATNVATMRSVEHPGDMFARAYQAAVWEQIRIANFPCVRTIIDIAP